MPTTSGDARTASACEGTIDILIVLNWRRPALLLHRRAKLAQRLLRRRLRPLRLANRLAHLCPAARGGARAGWEGGSVFSCARALRGARARGPHNSLSIIVMRCLTVAFASAGSCRTSTFPCSLKTGSSARSRSSSSRTITFSVCCASNRWCRATSSRRLALCRCSSSSFAWYAGGNAGGEELDAIVYRQRLGERRCPRG